MGKTEEPGYYAVIPAEVRYADIPANAKLLYGEISALCNSKGFCWATNNYFSKLYGVHKDTVSGWISILRDNGFILISFATKGKDLGVSRKMSIPIGKITYPPIGKKTEENNTRDNTTINITNNTPPIVPPRGDDVKPTDHVEIMKIMDLFYPTNPSLNFGRKSERDACRKLVKQFGLQETLKLVEAVVDFQGEPFSPVVTSPAALWEKLGKVAVFLKSGGRKDNSKRMGIHVLGKSKQSDNKII